MLWRVIEDKVVPTCQELGLSQIVWSPIAQGVLTGKYKPGQQPPTGSRATDEKGGADMIKRFMKDDVLTRVQQPQPVAEELDLTMAQLEVAWVLQNDNVATALVGASRPEQVTENVKASGVNIPGELMTRIDDILGDIVERNPGKTTATAPQQQVARRPRGVDPLSCSKASASCSDASARSRLVTAWGLATGRSTGANPVSEARNAFKRGSFRSVSHHRLGETVNAWCG